jgi:uncharacterized protein DUF3892
MGTFQVTRVRTEWGWGSSQHEHIAGVELENRADWRFSRDYIISQLKSVNGDRYYTFGGGQRAEVYVRGCPLCSFGSYITTTPDSTTTNNLLKLPRF